jgi:alkylhydroperoxidase family enzyme
MQRASMRVAGYSEQEIRRIERNVDLGDEHTRAIVDFCRRLAQSNPRPARAEREGLERLGFSSGHVRELAFEIAVGCMFHRFTTLFAAPPVEALERMSGKWWSIFLRPFFVIMRNPKKVAPVEDSGAGPWGALIAALNGTAAPPVLRKMVEVFFSDSVLSVRAKLLMLAVIARALGCPFCEQTVVELLEAEGLSREEIEHALDTMASPKLTALETTLLPFARATVRYEPYRIQERTARLLAEIGTEKALEVVGVASMGNMLVRLAMLLAP